MEITVGALIAELAQNYPMDAVLSVVTRYDEQSAQYHMPNPELPGAPAEEMPKRPLVGVFQYYPDPGDAEPRVYLIVDDVEQSGNLRWPAQQGDA